MIIRGCAGRVYKIVGEGGDDDDQGRVRVHGKCEEGREKSGMERRAERGGEAGEQRAQDGVRGFHSQLGLTTCMLNGIISMLLNACC